MLKDVGNLTRRAVDIDAEGYLFYMGSVLGWSREELTVFLAKFREEWRSNYYRPYWEQKVIWGRKPE